MEEALRVVVWAHDEDAPARSLARRLRNAGLQVVEIHSSTALAGMSAGDVDLLILASSLRDHLGEREFRRMRSQPALSGVPVLWLHDENRPTQRDALFDSLGDGVALLDQNGRVERCNRAMAELLNMPTNGVAGTDFFAAAAGLSPGRGGQIPGLAGREVVEWPHGERLFRVTAAPLTIEHLGADVEKKVVVLATDITELQKLNERAAESAAAALAAESRVEQLERDARLLKQFAEEAAARGESIPDAAQPLRTSRPDDFCELVVIYEDLLDRVMDRLTYRISDPLSETLIDLAERIGGLGAGPRDVVEIHGTALRHKTAGMTTTKARGLADEGRLLVLELMGHLVSFYRRRRRQQSGPATLGASAYTEGTVDGKMPDQALRDGEDSTVSGGHHESAPHLRGGA